MQTFFTDAQLADPTLAEANKILRACVHCGLCTATCPSYQVLGDELDSPRGRIYLIKEMLESGRAADAVKFYQSVQAVQPFSWAQIGLVRALFACEDFDAVGMMLERMSTRSDTKLVALEYQSELEFRNKSFDQAQQHLEQAVDLAPRNLFRQQKLQQLSRLNHDYERQYKSARDLLKFARHSMYEQPDLYLNLARACIDYAVSMDEDGEIAASGNPDQGLLNILWAHPFFAQAWPKSTGRDEFNEQWFDLCLSSAGVLSPEDVMATLLALTVKAVKSSLPLHVEQVYVCGGGSRNSTLMAQLKDSCAPVDFLPIENLGLPSQAVEAAAFAWLAMQNVLGKTGNCPSVTGARQDAVLGALHRGDSGR